MGSLLSRPSTATHHHPSSLTQLSSLLSSLALHLSALLNRFYNLLLSPLIRLEGPASHFYSYRGRAAHRASKGDPANAAAARGGGGGLPLHYRPGKRFKQQQDVERRRRRAKEVAEMTGVGDPLLEDFEDGEGGEKEEEEVGLNGAKGASKAAKRRSAPPRYTTRPTPMPAPLRLTRAQPGLLDQQPLRHPTSAPAPPAPATTTTTKNQISSSATSPTYSRDPPLANVKIRAVSASPPTPHIARPSPAFLLDDDSQIRNIVKGGAAAGGGGKVHDKRLPEKKLKILSPSPSPSSPRSSSLDIRRQVLLNSTSQTNNTSQGQQQQQQPQVQVQTRATSMEVLPFSSSSSSSSSSLSLTLSPISRTSTTMPMPITMENPSSSPRTSLSDLASAACSRKNPSKERRLWREEIDRIARRKVSALVSPSPSSASAAAGGGNGGNGAGAGGKTGLKRSSLGNGMGVI